MEFTPLINGTSHSWSDITVNILGVPVPGIRAVSYTEKQEKVDNYGSGRRPVSRGYGKIEVEASVTMLSEEVLALQKAVSSKNILDIPPFDILVSYMPKNSTNITTDILKNCEFKQNVRDTKVDDTSIEVQLDLICSHIVWDA
jgi:hypothetical protein